MIRVLSAFGVAVIGVGLCASPALAQGQPAPAAAPAAAPQAPALTPILAGKNFTPPMRGQADVDFIRPDTKNDKGLVITRIKVKNTSTGPIARLTVSETWYGKDGQVVTGGKGFVNGLLKPGDTSTVEIQTPYDAKMSSNNFNFAHANGTVKPHQVKTFDEPKDAAKPPAAAAKPAPAAKK